MIEVKLGNARARVGRSRAGDVVVLELDEDEPIWFTAEVAYTLAMAILKERAAVKKSRTSPIPTS